MENHYPYRNLGNDTKNSAERFPSRILLKIQSMSWCEVSFACGREAAKYNRGREKPLIVCSSEKNGEGNLLARSYLKTPESASQEKVLQFWHCFYCEKGIYFLQKKKKKLILLSISSLGRLYVSLEYLGQKHKTFNLF